MPGRCFVGTAGWSLPRDVQGEFPPDGSHLQRYAARFDCAEINSSFHREHKEAIWSRWAASVPAHFRFSAKLAKTITHERRLVGCRDLLDRFIAQLAPLGPRVSCLLVQLPPSLHFDAPVARAFLGELRARWRGDLALEPRHESWFGPQADALLALHEVARVLADPVRFASAAAPGGWPQLVYVRLHGSPRVYYSSYAPEVIDALAARIRIELQAQRTVWCIFDNTASGAAARDALALQRRLAVT